ncbi:MAG TPA: hypothetical protein PK765_05455 [bacterium]|nr:hypothetical protein [bacterium]
MHLAARAILIPLACLLFGACTISHEHRIVSVSLSGVTIDSASGTMFVAFSGIIVEPLYFETDTGCRQPDGELFVIESFSGSAVRFEDGIVVGDGGSLESQLVSAGYAVPDPANRSTQYSDLMRESVSARKSGRGIWNPCPPADV